MKEDIIKWISGNEIFTDVGEDKMAFVVDSSELVDYINSVFKNSSKKK